MLPKRTVCALLIASLAFLPPELARADVISTETAINSGAQTARAALLALLDRPEAVRELHALGVDQRIAEERIAAMTDDEIQLLASNPGSLPIGGQMPPSGGGGYGGGGSGVALVLIVILLVVLLVWWSTRKAG